MQPSLQKLCRFKDSERKVQTSEALIEVAVIRLLVARLGRRRAGSAHVLL